MYISTDNFHWFCLSGIYYSRLITIRNCNYLIILWPQNFYRKIIVFFVELLSFLWIIVFFVVLVIVLCYCLYAVLLYCYCVALLLFVLSYVLIVCTVPLPPGVSPIAVDKYIYININMYDFIISTTLWRNHQTTNRHPEEARSLNFILTSVFPLPRVRKFYDGCQNQGAIGSDFSRNWVVKFGSKFSL